MRRLIDCLPGVEMPVDEVAETLAHMWDGDDEGGTNLLGFRASQMNLLIHFGMRTTEAEASARFDSAVAFAQRYPCRLLVLCPSEDNTDGAEFSGKVFSQCFLGSHLRDACCCEALILSFDPGQSAFLESQMSLWLESDLPVYNWFHRVPVSRIDAHYRSFIKRSRRVLFDRAIEGTDYDEVDFGEGYRVHDLAHARTLPMRQNLGHFLSGIEPSLLVEDLSSVRFHYSGNMQAEARHLLEWHQRAIAKCAGRNDGLPEFIFEVACEGEQALCLIDWQFKDPKKYLKWEYNPDRRSGRICMSLTGTPVDHPLHIEPMTEASVLAEALFFG